MDIRIVSVRVWEEKDCKASQCGEVDFHSPTSGTRTAIIHDKSDRNGHPLVRIGHRFVAIDFNNQKSFDIEGNEISLEEIYIELG